MAPGRWGAVVRPRGHGTREAEVHAAKSGSDWEVESRRSASARLPPDVRPPSWPLSSWPTSSPGSSARRAPRSAAAISVPLRAHRILGEARGHHPPPRGELALGSRCPRPAGALALAGRPLRPPGARRIAPPLELRLAPRRLPHAHLDLGRVDAPRVRSRGPGRSPLWRPAACHRHRPRPRGGARPPRPPPMAAGARPPWPRPARARAHRGHRVPLRRPRGALRALPDPRRRPPTAATAALRPAHATRDDVPIAGAPSPARAGSAPRGVWRLSGVRRGRRASRSAPAASLRPVAPPALPRTGG